MEQINKKNIKICTKCGFKSKMPEKHFHKNKSTNDGLSFWCKKCKRKLKKKYYDKNRKSIINKAVNWAKENPEKRHKIMKTYRKKNKEKIKKASKIYYKKNKEHINKKGRKWKKENPKIRKENNRKWRKKNLEHYREYQKKWQRENSKKIRLYSKRKRARRRNYKINILFPNLFKGETDLHHIDNEQCVYLPRFIHRNFNCGPNKAKHRNMLSQIIYEVYYKK